MTENVESTETREGTRYDFHGVERTPAKERPTPGTFGGP
jgi:hypothetical protein